MYKKLTLLFLLTLFLIPFISSAPPQQTENGYQIRTAIPSYLKQSTYFDAHAHVFLVSDGTYVTDATCYLHLYNKNGTHIYTGIDNVVSNNFDYGWDIDGGNFSEIGTHTYIIQCNGTVGVDDFGGFVAGEFYVNGFGEGINEGTSLNFNYAMIFLLALFILVVVGIFTIEHYIAKFALYWIAHILFVVGTFSVWQFNIGYGMAYMGLAGIFKVLFYVGIIAVLPMMIMSMVWIFYIHTVNEDMKRWMEKGMPEVEAQRRAKNRRRY